MKNPNEAPQDGFIEVAGEAVRDTIEAYQRSPVLRMLVKSIPILSVAETGILGTYLWFQNRRLQTFADEFTTLGLNITEADAKRKEFFDAYTSTAQHVLAESREAKIRLFAGLFGEFVRGGCTASIDCYEEHLQLLDEISEREFKLLLILQRIEARHPLQPTENRLQRTGHFWAEFTIDAQKELGIDAEGLAAMLGRLARTGMYQEITGGYFDYGGGRGYLTVAFAEFLGALGMG
jgi:hypothetical protein